MLEINALFVYNIEMLENARILCSKKALRKKPFLIKLERFAPFFHHKSLIMLV